MNSLTVLEAWERGLDRGPAERAAALLTMTPPVMPFDPHMSIGQRDAALLALRASMFGPRLVAVTTCPVCGERLELGLEADQLGVGGPPPAHDLSVTVGELELTFRLPDSLDLDAVRDAGDVETARVALFRRCLVSARRGGEEPPAGAELGDAAVDAVSAAMGQADPQADLELAVSCPACRHRWSAALDIGAFLWAEVDHLARRLLREVDALASRYGWSQADILRLSPRRRRLYLDMAER